MKDIWKPIYLSRPIYSSSPEEGKKYFEEDFQKSLRRSYRVIFPTTHIVKIYESDIEFLNHLDLPYEIKKFCLMVIAYDR